MTDKTAASTPSGVRAKLVSDKARSEGVKSTTLPATGIAVSYPGFVGHDQVMAATKLAGKNRSRVGVIMVAQTCLFEGERLTVSDIGELVPNGDVVHLINLVLGEGDGPGGDDEADAGN